MITVMTATTTTMGELLGGFSDFVEAAVSSISTVVTAITSNPVLLLGVFASLLGIGVSLILKFVRKS